MLRQTIYKNRVNEIILAPYIEGTEFNAEDITRMIISFEDADGNVTNVDSNSPTYVSAFTFVGVTAFSNDATVPAVRLVLGKEGLAVRDDYVATFTIYSTLFSDGRVWDEKVAFDVRDDLTV